MILLIIESIGYSSDTSLNEKVCLYLYNSFLVNICGSIYSAQDLQSDEFNGNWQNMESFWNIKDGDKSEWEQKDGQLVVTAGFNS